MFHSPIPWGYREWKAGLVLQVMQVSPKVIRNYNAPKVRFSATVGEESEVELTLV